MNRSNAIFDRLVSQIQSAGKTDASACLIGEVGTGKRQAAASVHRCSGRASEQFVVLNCMGMDDATFRVDLFGSMGSDGQLLRRGAASIADEGTLYLHEVTELPRASQTALVRFLESETFRPVGGMSSMKTNVRLITSSSVSLEAAVDADRFRADLYHLLTPIVIHLPRLNDRRDDIPTLFRSVLFELTKSYDYPIEEGAFKLLMTHEFSGNLIELRNIASRALSSSSGRPITEDAVRAALRGTSYSDRDAYKLTDSLSIVNEDFKALDNELSRGALPSAAQAPVAAQPTQGRDTDSVFNSAATQMPALRELDDASAHSSGRAKEAAPIASVTTPPSHEERLSPPEAGGKVLSLKEQEAAYFRDLLDRYDGNKSKVADAAGLTLRTLYRRLKDAGIE